MRHALTAFAAGIYLGSRYGRRVLTSDLVADFELRAVQKPGIVTYTTARRGWLDAIEAVRGRV